MMRLTAAVVLLAFFSFNAFAKANFALTADSNYMAGGASVAHMDLSDTLFAMKASKAPIVIYKNADEGRLASIQKEIPLTYNEYVQDYIDILAGRGRERISHALGLAKYYFPIYKKIFDEENIPEEIKYLSVVESALNPNAVSAVGATGLWQFMYTTGKTYGLNIDHWQDERRDPVAATYAAAAYLKDAYGQFGDWLLAIASYNCGTGNVARAIQKAGGIYDFWAIRDYLPRETRNYIPAFIATVYMMHYYQRHQIIPEAAGFATRTEVYQVNSKVSLTDVANALDLDPEELCILNPSYIRKVINATPESPRPLVVPALPNTAYGALYSVLNHSSSNEDKALKIYASSYNKPVPKQRQVYYKVRSGDKLADIADHYGIEVQDLKVWNNIQQGVIVPGQVLRVSGPEEMLLKISNYFNYRVQPGDTLLKIAEKFNGVTVNGLKVVNDLKDTEVKPGMILKIVRG